MISNFCYSSIKFEQDGFYYNSDADINTFYNINYSCYGFDYNINQYTSDPNFNSNNKFFSKLSKMNNFEIDSGILPPAIKYHIPGLVVFERPPSYQVVQYIPLTVNQMDGNDPANSENIHVYRIPIPWQLYIISYNPKDYLCQSVQMLFMKSSLAFPDQQVYMPTLPNFFTNGLLCRPMYESMNDIDRYSKDLSGVIQSAYDWIWNSGFNNDLLETFSYLKLTKSPIELLSSDSNLGSLNPFSLNPLTVPSIFSTWEKVDIDNILNLTWPNPSLTHHFEDDREYYIEYDYDRFDVDNPEDFSSLHEEEQTYKTVITAAISGNSAHALINIYSLEKALAEVYKSISS